MKIYSALSQNDITIEAAREVSREVAKAMAGLPIDLVFVFLSPHHSPHTLWVQQIIRDTLQPKVLLGCTAEGIIEGQQEIHAQPALCIWAAHLPRTTLTPFYLSFEQTDEGAEVHGWPAEMPPRDAHPSFLILGEPFTTPVEALLQSVNERYPGAPAMGGMASAAHKPGGNRLIFNNEIKDAGAVGVALSGDVRIRTVVSQGCRPIGQRFMVTDAEQNVIHELSGKSALDRLREVFAQLSPTEQRQAERALQVGLVIDEHKDRFERGDFLIRNLVGADQQTGSIAVGDMVKEGQTIQFQLRDAAAASEDLHALLTSERSAQPAGPPQGALVFSCNGRGERLFRVPHHDATAIREEMGTLPVGGFFAMGEIGPVGGSNFLHSFTASVALFCSGNAKG